ncbi:ferric reductase-like transmembrane domain-containing protein [Microbulbifer sp. S227A]|uniref:ferric reductase-like transmembrane domain-containing protein n=1 Tax=Microbulbifer sp. S227A TaxID=3415131 RepID=UPI003C7DD264
MPPVRAVAIWSAFAAIVAVPMIVAAQSPLLAWRQPVYIAAGFAGVLAMVLLLVQPLLIGRFLPGVDGRRARLWHRLAGFGLVGAVVAHVAMLWMTSPPDVVDALLLVSPTPFSDWGVIAMWAVFAAALFAVLRRRMRPAFWRSGHVSAVLIAAGCSVVHAMLVEGTMGLVSKTALCLAVVAAVARVGAARLGRIGR